MSVDDSRLTQLTKREKTSGEIILLTQGLLFVDFEASSLDEGSWPIEIGMSSVNPDLSVSTWDSLIRPAKDWHESHWSPVSAEIHNISRAALLRASEAVLVADEVVERALGKVLLSDSPIYEYRWMSKLLSTRGQKPLLFSDLDVYLMTIFAGHEAAIDEMYEFASRRRPPHRAGPDSALMAQMWVRGIEAVQKNEPRNETETNLPSST